MSTEGSSPVFKRPDSRFWWCRLPDSTGRIRRESTKCIDERAAWAYWRREERRRAVGATDRPARSATLTQGLANLVVDRRELGRAEATIDMYGEKGRWLCQHIGTHRDLREIDAVVADEYRAKRLADGAHPSTIHKEMVTLRLVLKVARRRGEYDRDPADVIKPGVSTGYVPKTRRLTREDFEALLDEMSPTMAALVAFCVATSARKGEARNARRSHIDFRAGLVHLVGTKNDRADRFVPITWLAEPLLRRALAGGDGPDDQLFASVEWPYNSIRSAAARATKKRLELLGVDPSSAEAARFAVPYVCLNDLRRTYASLLQEAGVRDESIAKTMGHRDTAMLERVYGQMAPHALAKLVAADLGPAPTVSDLGSGSRKKAASAHQPQAESPRKQVGQDGLEPSANGLRGRPGGTLGIASSHSERENVSILGSTVPRLVRRGPAYLYRGVREPRTFGELVDQALRLGAKVAS